MPQVCSKALQGQLSQVELGLHDKRIVYNNFCSHAHFCDYDNLLQEDATFSPSGT
jgi:hypothetical protein